MSPLTGTGKKVKRRMEKTYGKKKGESVFYASMKKHKAGTNKWHTREKAMRMLSKGGKK